MRTFGEGDETVCYLGRLALSQSGAERTSSKDACSCVLSSRSALESDGHCTHTKP